MRLISAVVVAFSLLAAPSARAQTDAFPNLWTPDNQVRGMAVAGDTLYIGGDFEYVGPPTGLLATLDKRTGEADLTRPRFGSYGTISAIVSDTQGGYYVGGSFRFVGNEEQSFVAHLLADGSRDSEFNPDPYDTNPFNQERHGSVSALAFEDGVLYVGGNFDTIGGQSRRALAAIDVATNSVLPLSVSFTESPTYPGTDPYVSWLAVRNGVLYMTGLYGSINGEPSVGDFGSLFTLNASTGGILPWAPATDAPFQILTFTDSTAIISGAFATVGGLPRRNVAEVTLADSTTGAVGTPTTWSATFGTTCINYINDAVVTPSHVWLSGSYYRCGGGWGGRPLTRVPRTGGTVEPLAVTGEARAARGITYDPTGGADGQGLLYLAGGKLIGGFDPSPVIYTISPSTGAATGFEILGAPGYYGTDYIDQIVVEPGPDGRILAGGSTFSIGGVRRRFLAGLDLTTGRPTGLADGALIYSSVEELVAAPDDRFLYLKTFNGLGEVDLVTGVIRTFAPEAAHAASLTSRPTPRDSVDGPPPVHTPADGIAEGSGVVRGGPTLTARVGARPARSAGGGEPRLLGGYSTLIADEETVWYCPLGCVSLDRETEQENWTRILSGIGRSTTALYVDGPGGPGGPDGTLFLSGYYEGPPFGTHPWAFVALDPHTGTVFDWNAGAVRNSSGGALAWLDLDGSGPGAPTLYLGGDRIEFAPDVYGNVDMAAVDSETAALRAWDPEATIAVGGPVGRMAAHRTRSVEDGTPGGVVYASGNFRYVRTEPGPSLVAFDAVTAAPIPDWNPRTGGRFYLDPAHEALFIGGFFQNSLLGSGHGYVVGVEPVRPMLLPTGGASGPSAPVVAALSLAGPNPARSRTALSLALPSGQDVAVSLYDVLGRRVAVLHEGLLGAGQHTLGVDASALPAGVYVARVVGATVHASLTVTVVR